MSELAKTLNVNGFIAYLKSMQVAGMRGPLADIERSISPTQRYRAYQYIANFCDLQNNQHAIIMATIGGMFVRFRCKNLSSDCHSNFGDSMRALADHNNTSSTSVDRRMTQIIANTTGVDACGAVVYALEFMRSRSIDVDFIALIQDLVYWNDKIIRKWAYSYYTKGGIYVS